MIIFTASPSDCSSSPYTINSLADEVLSKYLPQRCVIVFSTSGKSTTSCHYVNELQGQLTHILLKKGYTVTYATHNNASYHVYCEIVGVESQFPYTGSRLHLSINIEKLPDGDSVLKRDVKVIVTGNSEDAKRFDVVGNLTYLVGSEAELKNIKINDNTDSRTSTVNERDIEIGASLRFPQKHITSLLTVRNRNSFGKDDFQLYNASFAYTMKNTTYVFGIYPLKFGRGSRYLNSSVERPYWNTGLLYDSVITGLSLVKLSGNSTFSLYWGANRNPSMVLATQWNYSIHDKHENTRFGVSINGAYVNRDDVYNDIASIAGMEVTWQRGERLFLYGFSGYKYYNGTSVNRERRIIPLLGEYEYAVTRRIVLKGAYLSINHDVEHDDTMRENTLYQEVDYRISRHWVPGVQFERFIIKDFWENTYTFIVHWFSGNRFSDRMHKTGVNGKIRYIDPEIGKERIFIGLEGTIQF